MHNNTLFVVKCERISRRQAYYLQFPYNTELINKIKELPDETKKWNGSNKSWEVTTPSLLKLIKIYKGSNLIHFDFGDEKNRNIFIQQIKKAEIAEIEKKKLILELNINKEKWVKYKEELENNYEQYIERVHANLKDGVKLYKHQVVGAMFLDKVRNMLLALDMGTGKTIISIAYVEMNNFEKVFVITPNSLKFNYYQEIKKFTNSKAYIINWKKNEYTIEESKYIIVNYDYFNSSNSKKVLNKFNDLNIGKIDCLISDESHKLANNQSNTFKNFKKIFKKDKFKNNLISKIFMSGTPAPSKVAQLYTQLNQISPLEFATKKYFLEYYCGMTYDINGFGWVLNKDETKYEELFYKISPFTYRKKKRDVLKDLPEKTYQKVILEMTSKEYKLYDEIEKGVADEFVKNNNTNPLAIMGKLRRYTSHLKINGVSELIGSILNSNEKFVTVDFFKESLSELHNQYKDVSVLHTGDFKDYERAKMISDFQDDNSNVKIFFGTESTTKEGLTLTAASKIGILSLPWNPGVLDQISDRLARIGQRYAVNAYLFIYKDTIDEYIFSLIEEKRGDISQVIDNENYKSDINQSIINDLVKKIVKKHRK